MTYQQAILKRWKENFKAKLEGDWIEENHVIPLDKADNRERRKKCVIVIKFCKFVAAEKMYKTYICTFGNERKD